MASRLSVSVTPELNQVLRALAKDMDVDLSRLIETLLRESPLIQGEVGRRRTTGATKRGRDVRELLVLGRVAARQWDERVRTGQVKPA